jgi:hypothetical protein
MTNKKETEQQTRGWIPKSMSYPIQGTHKLNADGYFAKITAVMRMVYGLALMAILFTPFGVYHSRVEPYIVGSLWGYSLPIGYIGLAVGIIAILFPKTILARKTSFGIAMVAIGVLLIGSLYLVPREPFINWINGTNFSSSQIDIDFAVGNAITLFIGLFSIITGLTSRISVHFSKKNHLPSCDFYEG